MRLIIMALLCAFIIGCETQKSSDLIQQQEQEVLLKEATSQTGMPAIKNFRERKLLKDILELRDQEGLVTYTYVFNELNGELVYLGETIGYGIPYATQYTNPEKVTRYQGTRADGGVAPTVFGYEVLPQADPNGLFSPESAEGTWIMLKDPNSGKVVPVYVEPRIIVSPFKLK